MMNSSDARFVIGIMSMFVGACIICLGGTPGIASGAFVLMIGAGIVRQHWEIQ